MDKGLRNGKTIRYHLNSYGWLKLMTCSNNCREHILQKKTTVLKNDKLPHQKSRFFITSKGVDLSLDVWPLRKTLKPFLQNIYVVSDLL